MTTLFSYIYSTNESFELRKKTHKGYKYEAVMIILQPLKFKTDSLYCTLMQYALFHMVNYNSRFANIEIVEPFMKLHNGLIYCCHYMSTEIFYGLNI